MPDDTHTPHMADDGKLALRVYLEPLDRFLLDPYISEICVNSPGVLYVEGRNCWTRHEVPELTYAYCSQLATLMATSVQQRVNDVENILSATLPGGERVQVVVPPSVPQGTVSITIRARPATINRTMEQYVADGYFDDTRSVTPPLSDSDWKLLDRRASETRRDFCALAYELGKAWITELTTNDIELLRLRDQEDWSGFFTLAVQSRQNIVISGGTGSGKTTFTRTLTDSIDERDRIVTIEDTPELALPKHENHVHLFYSMGGQGRSKSDPQSLLASCMRMRPDRILLAELRGPETSLYVQGLNSGHPGSITTVHSNSPKEAFGRLADLMRQHKSSERLPQELLLQKLYSAIHVVCQINKDHETGKRSLSEVYFDPRCRFSGKGPHEYEFDL